MSSDDLKLEKAVKNANGKLGVAAFKAAQLKDEAANLNDLKKKAGVLTKIGAGFSKVGDTLGLSKVSKLKKSGKYNKVFEVAWNPSSFNISTYGGNMEMRTDASKRGNNISFTPSPVTSTLSVKLIFDRTDEQTAFPITNLRSNTATSAGKGIKMAKEIFAGPSVSVQTAVEGFIGAVRGKYTKQVCFEWGTMIYEGVCKTVTARYTLFDALGVPTRAEVDLSIYLWEEDARAGEGGVYSLGTWEQAYKDAFSSSNSFGNLGQKAMERVFR